MINCTYQTRSEGWAVLTFRLVKIAPPDHDPDRRIDKVVMVGRHLVTRTDFTDWFTYGCEMLLVSYVFPVAHVVYVPRSFLKVVLSLTWFNSRNKTFKCINRLSTPCYYHKPHHINQNMMMLCSLIISRIQTWIPTNFRDSGYIDSI